MNLKSLWQRSKKGVLLLTAASVIGVVGGVVISRAYASDCCATGSACCKPGAACCSGHKHASL